MDHDGSFVVSGSEDERALIRIAALGARMRGSDCGGVHACGDRNEEDSARKVSNEQDVRELRSRIIWLWAKWR